MTYRTVLAYGLIAGIGYRDSREMSPALVCDMYVLRQRYDDEQHGITRTKE